jgi:LysR family hydrogen peroxide-inducible transcriptional activator
VAIGTTYRSMTLAGLSLRDLEYAVAVAELRHFGRAAARCGVSQPALSEQIRKLESVLGVVLFERTNRRVEPTPQGEALLHKATLVVHEARGLLEMARAQSNDLAGSLRLGVIATLGPYYLPLVLRDVRARFPMLELRVEEGRTESLMEALQRGALDMVLLALPAPAEGLVAAPLFFEPFLLAGPAGHALQARPELTIADLDGADLLLLEDGHCLREQALSLCGAPRAERESRSASSLEMLRHMIAAGEGYSLLPLLAVQERGDLLGLIFYRPLHDGKAGRTIGLVWRSTDPRRAAFVDFSQMLRAIAPTGTAPTA